MPAAPPRWPAATPAVLACKARGARRGARRAFVRRRGRRARALQASSRPSRWRATRRSSRPSWAGRPPGLACLCAERVSHWQRRQQQHRVWEGNAARRFYRLSGGPLAAGGGRRAAVGQRAQVARRAQGRARRPARARRRRACARLRTSAAPRRARAAQEAAALPILAASWRSSSAHLAVLSATSHGKGHNCSMRHADRAPASVGGWPQ
jgi:hypothetical protein